MLNVIDYELFTSIKQEEKVGHTPTYSALLHDLEPEVVAEVLKAKDYEDFCLQFDDLAVATV